jgi:hypothetical protein
MIDHKGQIAEKKVGVEYETVDGEREKQKVDEAWQKEMNGNVECDHGFGNA